MSGGTITLLSTKMIHVSQTCDRDGKTLCGLTYRMRKRGRWQWSYPADAKDDCKQCTMIAHKRNQ